MRPPLIVFERGTDPSIYETLDDARDHLEAYDVEHLEAFDSEGTQLSLTADEDDRVRITPLPKDPEHPVRLRRLLIAALRDVGVDVTAAPSLEQLIRSAQDYYTFKPFRARDAVRRALDRIRRARG
jgi:hypothetical protein